MFRLKFLKLVFRVLYFISLENWLNTKPEIVTCHTVLIVMVNGMEGVV